MKKALTLIELIFTIVIIAAVFTVIPKIIYISNKSLEFSKKEDAVFNMIAKMMDVSLKEYDYNNTKYDDILIVNDPPENILDCNASTWYRVGGFRGGRNCKNYIFESDIPSPQNSDDEHDYIEGYNGYEDNLSSGHTRYTLNIAVGYTTEWEEGNYSNNSLDFSFKGTLSNQKTNIKKIVISIKKEGDDKNISIIRYNSANIGHTKINSVIW
jgi:type II secretory pathway pseudopilin PulG